MGVRFDETIRGRKFYDGDLPRLIKAIEANTAELKRANDLKEAELGVNGVIISEQPEKDSLHDGRD